MASSLLDTLGRGHLVFGRIIYNGSGVPALSGCNDESATLADTGTGIATLTFGEAFSSVPVVVALPIKGTEAATTNNHVVVDSITTTVVVFRFKVDAAATNSTADPADTDGCSFMIAGFRNV